MSKESITQSEDYQALFGRQWAPWVGGLLLGGINVLMFAYAKPWGVADGVGNWGNWVLKALDADVGTLVPPWVYTTSITNLAVIFGALIAALLSREFAIRISSTRDIIRSTLGGILLGIGSVLGVGCTIGAFLSGFSALSLAGPLFMAGLFVGALIGLKILMWDLGRESSPAARPPKEKLPGSFDWLAVQPLIGLALIILLVVYVLMDSTKFTFAGITGLRSMLVLLGVILGLVNQRSRFCFVRAFREPFMTGEGAMTKAGALALLVGVAGFAIIKGTDLSDMRPLEANVSTTVFLGSLLGGLIFGTGMVLTGGCASGSLWRLGEGQLKFVLVLTMFAVSNAAFSLFLQKTNGREILGDQAIFLPDLLGWPGAILALIGIAILWFLFAAWNEKTEKAVII